MVIGLKTIGFASCVLYSLLSFSGGHAAPVDFYFNGLLTTSPSQQGTTKTRSYRTLTGQGHAEMFSSDNPSHPVSRVTTSWTSSKADDRMGLSLLTRSPRLLTSSPADLTGFLSSQGDDDRLDQRHSVPLQLDEFDLRERTFTRDQFPSAPPSLSFLTKAQWRIIFDDPEGPAQKASLSQVFLPASVWLFGTGLVALVGLGSRGIRSHKDL